MSEKVTIFVAKQKLKVMITAVLSNGSQYVIPQSDTDFFKKLAEKMGWTKKETQTKQAIRKSGLDAALDDIAKGDLETFDSVDSLMEYLHS